MYKTIAAGLIALAIVCAGCSGHGSSGNAPAGGGTQASLSNPTDFPLSPGDKILAARPFEQTVDVEDVSGGSVLSQGKGTYSGHSVIAQGGGSIAQAKAWLAKTESTPPAGYTRVSTEDSARATALAARYGVTYGVFRKGAKGVVIVVVDTKVAHDKLGFLIDLANKYEELPASLRGPIDDQVKQRLGMSVTEALDPSAPVGMTLQALRTLDSSRKPAIVEVDAQKR